jgi:rhamnosyltransferase subunit B
LARILLTAIGSHGDVHPFAGLGRALQSRGHNITLIAFAPFRSVAAANGFDFFPVGTDDDYRNATHNPDLWHPKRSLGILFGNTSYAETLRKTHEYLQSQFVRGETVLVGSTLAVAARLAHDTLGVPLATVHLQPIALNSVEKPSRFPGAPPLHCLPRWFRRFFFWFGARRYVDPLLRPPVNAIRTAHGLPPLKELWYRWRNSPQEIILLFPEWFAAAPDWPGHAHHCGFVQYDGADSEPLPPEVGAFLKDGPAPVVVSFGSAMRTGGPYFAAAAKAFEQLKMRGLILAKAGEQIPKSLPANVLQADYAPFSAVFPRCAAVIHHGGVGTTAQCLAAGVPQIVMPLSFDQPDNAARLQRLGVADVLPPHKFTPDQIAGAIQKITSSIIIKQNCAQYADRMRSSDGIAAACQRIEALLGTDTAGRAMATR